MRSDARGFQHCLRPEVEFQRPIRKTGVVNGVNGRMRVVQEVVGGIRDLSGYQPQSSPSTAFWNTIHLTWPNSRLDPGKRQYVLTADWSRRRCRRLWRVVSRDVC